MTKKRIVVFREIHTYQVVVDAKTDEEAIKETKKMIELREKGNIVLSESSQVYIEDEEDWDIYILNE